MEPKENQCLAKKEGDRGLRRGGRIVHCTVLPPCHAEGSSSDALELRRLGVCPSRRACPRGGRTADRRRVPCGDRRVVCSVSCPVSLDKGQAGSSPGAHVLVPGLQRRNVSLGKGTGNLWILQKEGSEIGRTQGSVGDGAGIESGCWVSSSCSRMSTGDDGSSEFFKLKIPETL